MCPCCYKPSLLAGAAVNRFYHFDSNPMASPVTKVFVNVKPVTCTSWGIMEIYTWYVGTSVEHCHCYTVEMDKISAQHISGTVKCQHHTIKIIYITPADRIIMATSKLTSDLINQLHKTLIDHIEAIWKLRDVLLRPRIPVTATPQYYLIHQIQKYSRPHWISQKHDTIPTNMIMPLNRSCMIQMKSTTIFTSKM